MVLKPLCMLLLLSLSAAHFIPKENHQPEGPHNFPLSGQPFQPTDEIGGNSANGYQCSCQKIGRGGGVIHPFLTLTDFTETAPTRHFLREQFNGLLGKSSKKSVNSAFSNSDLEEVDEELYPLSQITPFESVSVAVQPQPHIPLNSPLEELAFYKYFSPGSAVSQPLFDSPTLEEEFLPIPFAGDLVFEDYSPTFPGEPFGNDYLYSKNLAILLNSVPARERCTKSRSLDGIARLLHPAKEPFHTLPHNGAFVAPSHSDKQTLHMKPHQKGLTNIHHEVTKLEPNEVTLRGHENTQHGFEGHPKGKGHGGLPVAEHYEHSSHPLAEQNEHFGHPRAEHHEYSGPHTEKHHEHLGHPLALHHEHLGHPSEEHHEYSGPHTEKHHEHLGHPLALHHEHLGHPPEEHHEHGRPITSHSNKHVHQNEPAKDYGKFRQGGLVIDNHKIHQSPKGGHKQDGHKIDHIKIVPNQDHREEGQGHWSRQRPQEHHGEQSSNEDDVELPGEITKKKKGKWVFKPGKSERKTHQPKHSKKAGKWSWESEYMDEHPGRNQIGESHGIEGYGQVISDHPGGHGHGGLANGIDHGHGKGHGHVKGHGHAQERNGHRKGHGHGRGQGHGRGKGHAQGGHGHGRGSGHVEGEHGNERGNGHVQREQGHRRGNGHVQGGHGNRRGNGHVQGGHGNRRGNGHVQGGHGHGIGNGHVQGGQGHGRGNGHVHGGNGHRIGNDHVQGGHGHGRGNGHVQGEHGHGRGNVHVQRGQGHRRGNGHVQGETGHGNGHGHERGNGHVQGDYGHVQRGQGHRRGHGHGRGNGHVQGGQGHRRGEGHLKGEHDHRRGNGHSNGHGHGNGHGHRQGHGRVGGNGGVDGHRGRINGDHGHGGAEGHGGADGHGGRVNGGHGHGGVEGHGGRINGGHRHGGAEGHGGQGGHRGHGKGRNGRKGHVRKDKESVVLGGRGREAANLGGKRGQIAGGSMYGSKVDGKLGSKGKIGGEGGFEEEDEEPWEVIKATGGKWTYVPDDDDVTEAPKRKGFEKSGMAKKNGVVGGSRGPYKGKDASWSWESDGDGDGASSSWSWSSEGSELDGKSENDKISAHSSTSKEVEVPSRERSYSWSYEDA